MGKSLKLKTKDITAAFPRPTTPSYPLRHNNTTPKEDGYLPWKTKNRGRRLMHHENPSILHHFFPLEANRASWKIVKDFPLPTKVYRFHKLYRERQQQQLLLLLHIDSTKIGGGDKAVTFGFQVPGVWDTAPSCCYCPSLHSHHQQAEGLLLCSALFCSALIWTQSTQLNCTTKVPGTSSLLPNFFNPPSSLEEDDNNNNIRRRSWRTN